MTTWHCSATTTELSVALQKVSVAQHPDPRSALSGVRLHTLGQCLHLTATDDNIRGAICHLPVTGLRGFWGVAPASFLDDVLAAFAPNEVVTLGTDGDQLIARGQQRGFRRWRMGDQGAFRIGCFEGTGAGWRVLERDRYWLKGCVQPVASLSLHGRRIEQAYGEAEIFEEAYSEPGDEEVAAPLAVAGVEMLSPVARRKPVNLLIQGKAPVGTMRKPDDLLITGSAAVASGTPTTPDPARKKADQVRLIPARTAEKETSRQHGESLS
jgi:hypothetical protein